MKILSFRKKFLAPHDQDCNMFILKIWSCPPPSLNSGAKPWMERVLSIMLDKEPIFAKDYSLFKNEFFNLIIDKNQGVRGKCCNSLYRVSLK